VDLKDAGPSSMYSGKGKEKKGGFKKKKRKKRGGGGRTRKGGEKRGGREGRPSNVLVSLVAWSEKSKGKGGGGMKP